MIIVYSYGLKQIVCVMIYYPPWGLNLCRSYWY